jgi:hypothetical protein
MVPVDVKSCDEAPVCSGGYSTRSEFVAVYWTLTSADSPGAQITESGDAYAWVNSGRGVTETPKSVGSVVAGRVGVVASVADGGVVVAGADWLVDPPPGA